MWGLTWGWTSQKLFDLSITYRSISGITLVTLSHMESTSSNLPGLCFPRIPPHLRSAKEKSIWVAPPPWHLSWHILTSPLTSLSFDVRKTLQCKVGFVYSYIFFQKLRLTFGSKIRHFLEKRAYLAIDDREIFMSIYSVLLPNLLGTSKNPKAANKMQRTKSPPILVFYWGSTS